MAGRTASLEEGASSRVSLVSMTGIAGAVATAASRDTGISETADMRLVADFAVPTRRPAPAEEQRALAGVSVRSVAPEL